MSYRPSALRPPIGRIPGRRFCVIEWETGVPGGVSGWYTDVRGALRPPLREYADDRRYFTELPEERQARAVREQQRKATNYAFFVEHVLPKIRAQLTPLDWQAAARVIGDPHASALYAAGGWSEAYPGTWVHPEATPVLYAVREDVAARRPLPAGAGIRLFDIPRGYVLRGGQYVYVDKGETCPGT